MAAEPARRALFAVLAVTLCAGASGQSRPAGRPNMIIVTVDTVRADHLGCYGYFREISPNIDGFARESVLFERAYASISTTLPSHATLFTGLEPLEHGVVANLREGGRAFEVGENIVTFADVAKKAGYATAAYISATPLKRNCGLAVGFDTYDQPKQAVRAGGDTIEQAIAWLSRHPPEPFLLWVHLFDPHYPYAPPMEYMEGLDAGAQLILWTAERAFPDQAGGTRCTGKFQTETISAINSYDAELRYVDDIIGRFFKYLRDQRHWNSAVVVLAGDHGEGLNQHNWPQHGRIWNEQLHVPLMIRFPDASAVKPRRISRLASLADVFPTIIGQLKLDWGGPLVRSASGRDVLADDFKERALVAVRSGRKCPDDRAGEFALTTPTWRLHVNNSEGADSLYRLSDDPHELRNLIASEAEMAAQLRKQLNQIIEAQRQRAREIAPRPADKARQLDKGTVRELKSLGYVGDDEDDEGASSP